jgi:hypothetical protein
MRHSWLLAFASLAVAASATAQTMPGPAIRPVPEAMSPSNRPPVVRSQMRTPEATGEVADTLSQAGVRPTGDALTGREEKAADGTLYKVEERTGLPRELRDLKDKLPPDPKGVIRQLGLRDEPARRVDYRDRTPTVEDIVQALRPQP